LFVVATPIGNLGDISQRAIECLSTVDRVLAEDTRHSGRLLQHLGIEQRLVPLHEHNEKEQLQTVLAWLQDGQALALISDAGTPLISDPGYVLVRELRRLQMDVIPIPGPSSIIAALSVAGLPTDQFSYHGFLPARTAERQKAWQRLLAQAGTHVVLESTHRLLPSLQDLQAEAGTDFRLVLCKELTKAYEAVWHAPVGELIERLNAQPALQKGEFVLLFESPEPEIADDQHDQLLKTLLAELPLKQAVALAVKITGTAKNTLYQRALKLKQS